MFTVKHFNEYGEFLFQTDTVQFKPLLPGSIGDAGYESTGSIWCDDQKYAKDGAPHIINSGTVYVMNEMGKTVSKYHLSCYGTPGGANGTGPI